MVTIPLRTRLEQDGTLDLRVATGLPTSEVDVLVILQPVPPLPAAWPEEFFESTYGAFAEHPLERGEPGAHELRRLHR